jgi:hypothetical protein
LAGDELLARANDPDDASPYLLDRQSKSAEHIRGDSLLLAEQAERMCSVPM